MNFVFGTSTTLKSDLIERIARYRYQVFVEKLGWDLPVQSGIELDEFDRSDTIYVVTQDESGRIIGAARLLPTHRPYLLGAVFPQLMGGEAPPNRSDVWELSRFAAIDPQSASAGPMLQFSAPLAVSLMRKIIGVAAAHGVTRLIAVSPLGVERLLRRAGFVACCAAPSRIVNGQPLFACWIEVCDALGE